MRFSIDDHDLEVVRFQKSPINPIVAKSLDLHAGYRYDVVLTGKTQPPANYVRITTPARRPNFD